jgi:hypothetical protein
MVGFNGFDNLLLDPPISRPSTYLESNGTRVDMGLEALSSIGVTPAGGVLAFLPVSTNLPIGVYQIVGTVDSRTNTGIENDDIVVTGTFTVTAVPEPGALAMFAVVGISGLAVHRFRTAAKKVTV